MNAGQETLRVCTFVRITRNRTSLKVSWGAPLFMWIFAIRCAVFINNITACYYSKVKQWATPYELAHGEPFPDTSIVVPFGCGALILNDVDDRSKFKSRCTLMIFLHYADEHPLFTYAFYSPRTKRVVHRQDCIFLTSVFPMRTARVASGLPAEGDALHTFRSPLSMREGSPLEFSFQDWDTTDPLPEYEDDVNGFSLVIPPGNLVVSPMSIPDLPVHIPHHPSFGEPSGWSSQFHPVSLMDLRFVKEAEFRIIQQQTYPRTLLFHRRFPLAREASGILLAPRQLQWVKSRIIQLITYLRTSISP